MGVEEYGFPPGRLLTFTFLHPYVVSPSVWGTYHPQANTSAWELLALPAPAVALAGCRLVHRWLPVEGGGHGVFCYGLTASRFGMVVGL